MRLWMLFDGNYAKDFQTAGFNSLFFLELFLFVFLYDKFFVLRV